MQLKARFHLRTNVTCKYKSTLDLQIGFPVLLHFSANMWYHGASYTVRHAQYVTFVLMWKRTLSRTGLSSIQWAAAAAIGYSLPLLAMHETKHTQNSSNSITKFRFTLNLTSEKDTYSCAYVLRQDIFKHVARILSE
jgi:hypothetical protein